MRPCRSTFLLVTCVTYLGVAANPATTRVRDLEPVLASGGSLDVAQTSPPIAAGQFPLRHGSPRSRLQSTQVKKNIAATYNTIPQHSNVAGAQWGWLWWSLVLMGVLGATGGLLYLLRRFGKAKKMGEPETPSDQVSLNERLAESRKTNAGEFEATAQSSIDLLAVEQTTRLAKINIVDELIKELRSPDRTKRQKAIWALGQEGDSRAVQPMVELMLDSDSQQRSLILAALAEIGTRTLKPMNRALAISLQDENAEVRKNAIRDLTRVYDLMVQISQLLCHAVEDPDADVQETARWALSQMNRIRAVPDQREQGAGNVVTTSHRQSLKLLFVSTPVGPLGTGLGGGVELSLYNIAQEMIRRGHTLQIVAPEGSIVESLPRIVQIPGNFQIIAQSQERTAPITMPGNSLLANMWDYARQVQADYDLIVNFAYDWLPFYLTPFFTRPIAHFVSMGSLYEAMDQIVEQVASHPGTIGFYTPSQAATFAIDQQCRYLSSGIDLSLYQFCSQPKPWLAWLGRIAPEKGLEDAIAAVQIVDIPLKIMGKIQDQSYWQQICQDYPDAPFEYLGFLPTAELQQELRQCRALLMTPRWVEAFGNVAIEALACGVPVIAYRRGGPSEIVQDGKTGFLVEPDSVAGLVDAIARLDEIDRHVCRQQAEAEYSLEALGDRFEQWFQDILTAEFI